MADLMESGAAAGKDDDGGAVTNRKSWLVTSTGRVKMVHQSSRRGDDWGTPTPMLEEQAVVTNLITCKYPFDESFSVVIVRDEDDYCGFDVNKQTLAVANVARRIKNHTPMMDGDIVTEVNNVHVRTFREYQAAIKNIREFTLTVHPGSDDHAIQSTPLDGGIMAVEFTQADVVAREDAGSVQVLVRRSGDTYLRLEWGWSIRNESVVDKIFRELQPRGTLVFEAGMVHASLQVQVPQDPTWNAEALYWIDLDPAPLGEPPSNVKVMLGDQQTLRVYSINMVTFPSGIYGNIGEQSKVELPLLTTVWGFWMHNYDEIRFATKVGFFLSLLPPILSYFQQMIWEVVINCGLVGLEPGEKCMVWDTVNVSSILKTPFAVLLFGAIAKVIFALLEHIIHVRFRMLRLGGQATMKLRANIFNTMLQLTEAAEEEFDDGDVCKVLDTETRHAIESVWMKAFECVHLTGSLCVKLVLCIQLTTHLPLETALMLVLSIPLMLVWMLIVLRLRRNGDHDRFNEAFDSDENWNAYVIMCEACRPVILQYKKGWAFTRQFNELHKAFNGKDYGAKAESSNTLWMVRYFFVLVGAGVVLLGGHAVQSKKLLVGGFLILLKAVEGVGKDLYSVAKILQAFISGTAAIEKIAKVLNAQTRRQERITQPENPDDGMVEEQIMLEEVSYAYPMTQRGVGAAVPKVNLAMPTGMVICCPTDVGNVGIHTLFRLIAGHFVPQTGKMRIPSHWNLIYVPNRPILFDGTLMYNLLIGDEDLFGDRQKTSEMVWSICQALGMSPELLHKDDFDVGGDGCCLKFSDTVIVSITRALVQHVDLLLISSVLDILGQGRAVKVLRFLRKYTEHRGLPAEPLPYALRRRKTVVYTTKYRMLQEQAAHRIEREQLLPLQTTRSV